MNIYILTINIFRALHVYIMAKRPRLMQTQAPQQPPPQQPPPQQPPPQQPPPQAPPPQQPPPQPIRHPNRINSDDIDPRLCNYFMDIIGSCTRFSLMHYNAEEHIWAYASDLNVHEPTSKRSAICSWLAWVNELD